MSRRPKQKDANSNAMAVAMNDSSRRLMQSTSPNKGDMVMADPLERCNEAGTVVSQATLSAHTSEAWSRDIYCW